MNKKPMLNNEPPEASNRLAISEMIMLTLFALVSVAVKQMLRLDLNLPGHSYILYIFFMVFGSTYVPKRGAALYMGMAAGIFAVIAGSRKGILDVVRFVAPGIVIEITRLFPTLGHPVVNRMAEGLFAALSMHVAKSGINLMVGKPFEVVLVKFYPGLVTYTIIGIACGLCAHFMEKAIRTYKHT
ncbi:MAG: hypothetical protein GY737_27235 [Desulfobacteraceae bacterium]|nr:hypothetical protein [Desulfobacteraceae bacterium]